MKIKLLCAAVGAAVVTSGVAVTGVAVANSAPNAAARSIAHIAESLLARDEIEPLKDILTQGSVQVSLDSVKENGEELLENSHIRGKMYFAKDALFAENVDIKIDDTKIVGEAYISKDLAYIKEEYILQGAYGAEWSTLADDLADSIFEPDSGSEYALDDDIYDNIIQVLDSMEKSKDLKKDVKTLVKKLGKQVWKIVAEHADISKENTQIRLNREKTNVRLISIVIDADAMEEIVLATYDYLCETQLIVDFIEKYDDPIALALYGPEYSTATKKSLVEEYEYWLEDLEEDVEDACDEIKKEFETITVELATPKLSKDLLKLDVKVGNSREIMLDCGKKGLEKTDKITLEISGGEIEIVYEIKENNNKKYNAELSVDVDGDTYEMSLLINREKEEYKATYKETSHWYSSYGGNSVYTDVWEIKGDYIQQNSTTKLTVKTMNNTYGRDYEISNTNDYQRTYQYKLTCEIVFDTNDKIPSAPKNYKSIADIQEKDIDGWRKKIEDLYP